MREMVLACSAINSCRRDNATEESSLPKELASRMKAIGWVVLADVPGHEIVFGAVTQPWLASPYSNLCGPKNSLSFSSQDLSRSLGRFVLIQSVRLSIARTETRVTTTDVIARASFRRYWSLVLPGIVLIRRLLLRAVRKEAERRARGIKPEYETTEFGQYVA
jgi:hypothetical protein